MKSFKNIISRFLFREDGGKKVLNKKHAALLGGLVAAMSIAGATARNLLHKEDRSQIAQSDVPVVNEGTAKTTPKPGISPLPIGGVADSGPKEVRHATPGRRVVIRYKAKQVIGPAEPTDRIPRGANFIGKLVASIDTRSPQSVQVALPYGGNPKTGGSLPPQTVLFGQASYPGQGERVYVTFDHGLLPDGQEISLKAQALSASDYATGMLGEFHGNAGNRIASVLGLSMVSGISEVMVEKEALGQTYAATPKASLKNGFYNGLAKVTEMEASRQAEKLANVPEYVTIDAGADLIVSITASSALHEAQ